VAAREPICTPMRVLDHCVMTLASWWEAVVAAEVVLGGGGEQGSPLEFAPLQVGLRMMSRIAGRSGLGRAKQPVVQHGTVWVGRPYSRQVLSCRRYTLSRSERLDKRWSMLGQFLRSNPEMNV